MSSSASLLPYIFGLVVLLGLSAFFSGSETALFALSRAVVKRMSGGSAGERMAAELLREPQRLLSTILVGNMLVNVMIASLIAGLAQRLAPGHGVVGPAIAVTTCLLLVFGELTPKTVAFKHARPAARLAAIPLSVFSHLIAPVRLILRHVTSLLLTVLGQRHVPGWSMLTHDEIAGMLVAGQAAGVTDERERELIDRILNLSSIDARDIMVPRTEVLGVSDELTVRAAFVAACRCRHSRLPIYHRDLDDIWGVIAVVDLTRWRDTETMDCVLSDLRADDAMISEAPEDSPIYPVHLIPETAKVEPLLSTMQSLRAQLVVIVDEYGGTSGILTLQDVLAEVVGRISPAADETGENFVACEGYVLTAGRVHMRELNYELGLALPRSETDTVGGYVMELLGRLPRAGDTAEDDRYRFHVIKMAGRTVGALRIEENTVTAAGEGND